MRFLFLCLFVVVMALTPVLLFEHAVKPQLKTLNQSYQSADQTAARLVAE